MAVLVESNQLHVTMQVLFLSLYKNFSSVLLDRLPECTEIGASSTFQSSEADAMTMYCEELSVMEVDKEKEAARLCIFAVDFWFKVEMSSPVCGI